ncbi:hypothetical protein FB451DRAFT_1404444 [Mycena latifolia]|nr:hypothetical protein FB451DRAFT_1404444 [Mycena latifolia]
MQPTFTAPLSVPAQVYFETDAEEPFLGSRRAPQSSGTQEPRPTPPTFQPAVRRPPASWPAQQTTPTFQPAVRRPPASRPAQQTIPSSATSNVFRVEHKRPTAPTQFNRQQETLPTSQASTSSTFRAEREHSPKDQPISIYWEVPQSAPTQPIGAQAYGPFPPASRPAQQTIPSSATSSVFRVEHEHTTAPTQFNRQQETRPTSQASTSSTFRAEREHSPKDQPISIHREVPQSAPTQSIGTQAHGLFYEPDRGKWILSQGSEYKKKQTAETHATQRWFRHESILLGKIRLEPYGCKPRTDTSANTYVFTLLIGDITAQVGDSGPVILNPGATLLVQAYTSYKFNNIAPEAAILSFILMECNEERSAGTPEVVKEEQ